MPTALRVVALALAVAAAMAAAGLVYVKTTGLRALPAPGPLETRLARIVRGAAIPREIKMRENPSDASADAITRGLEHFARYCAMCHGNDGSGRDTPIGRGLFPRPPDMRTDATQRLTDGELFYIIENGVRFTGMPAFGSESADPAGEELAWHLVRFIRRLPRLTRAELARMEALNPL